MLELGNVLNTSYGANVIIGAYNGTDNSSGTDVQSNNLNNGDVELVIEQLLGDNNFSRNISDARNANEAVSMSQSFEEASSAIVEKFIDMAQLAEAAATGTYSEGELAEMQQQFEQLAGEINTIVDSTEYDGNKLFGSEGQTISISIGNGSSIDIAANDMSLDVDGIDLTDQVSAEESLSSINESLQAASSYNEYLSTQTARLGNAASIIEFDIAAESGVEDSELDSEAVMEIAAYAASVVFTDITVLFETAINLVSERVAQLLEDIAVPVTSQQEE